MKFHEISRREISDFDFSTPIATSGGTHGRVQMRALNAILVLTPLSLVSSQASSFANNRKQSQTRLFANICLHCS